MSKAFFRGMTLAVAVSASWAASANGQEAAAKCPPTARVDMAKDTYGTTVVADPYRWLEDQQSAETRAWIAAEQKCTEAALGKLPSRDGIAKRLTELYRSDTVGIPIERNHRYFYSKRAAGDDLSKICVRQGRDGKEKVLIDPLPWSDDHSASVVIEGIRADGGLIFYGRRDGGQDEVTLRAMSVQGELILPDTFPKGEYFSVEPTPDRRGVYYALRTDKGPRAFYHELGTDSAHDPVVFGESLDKDKILSLQLTEDGKYLVYAVSYGSGTERTDIYAQNVKEKGAAFPVVNDVNALFFPIVGTNGHIFISTNWKAPQWRVFSADLTAPTREHWKEIIPEGKVHLESVNAVAGKLVAVYTNKATSEMKIFDAEGKNERTVELPGLGTVNGSPGRWEDSDIFYSFESFNVPPSVLRYDVATGKSETWWRPSVPVDSTKFETEQVWYESKDKTRVPMFLFYKKGMKRDGKNPVRLTAYGGFDVSLTPTFDEGDIVWAEHGGIQAVANLRGGGEFGEEWHRAGMFEKKQNVFDDFYAAAEYLVREKYTSSGKLAIEGGSNGGLLMGAALTQRPDLFRAIVCAYPLLDMLRFQKFLSGPYWVSEYGSSDDLQQFPYIYAYSPYQHVVDGKKYPSVLFVTGDGDTRVAPLHARKMAARVQAATGSGATRPVLLLYDTKSGHSGGRPVNKQIEEGTDILSYLLWQLGVN